MTTKLRMVVFPVTKDIKSMIMKARATNIKPSTALESVAEADATAFGSPAEVKYLNQQIKNEIKTSTPPAANRKVKTL